LFFAVFFWGGVVFAAVEIVRFLRATICTPFLVSPAKEGFTMAEVASVGFSELNLEALRTRLQKMSDQELLRYGQAAKSMCSPAANSGEPPESFLIQLEEARTEWKRRNPDLPLNESI
jgi:hypothetical protein